MLNVIVSHVKAMRVIAVSISVVVAAFLQLPQSSAVHLLLRRYSHHRHLEIKGKGLDDLKDGTRPNTRQPESLAGGLGQ